MPNSFMGMDVEKWPIMESHRRDCRRLETHGCVVSGAVTYFCNEPTLSGVEIGPAMKVNTLNQTDMSVLVAVHVQLSYSAGETKTNHLFQVDFIMFDS